MGGIASRSVMFVVVLVALAFVNLGAAPPVDRGRDARSGTERIIIKFKTEADDATRERAHRENGGALVDRVSKLDAHVVAVGTGETAKKIADYARRADVEYVEPDFVLRAAAVPNDPYLVDGTEWGMNKVQAPLAWGVTTGSPNVGIAIADTGVDANHPDLLGKVVAARNFTSSDPAAVADEHGHGTHVGGIAAAVTNNGTGVAGLGYNSSLMSARVLDASGSGYNSWIANGIIWAADNGAKVINLSLGGKSGSRTLESAVRYAWGKGAVVVAAAGNEGSSGKSYPGAYADAIAVAATDSADNKASWSNYGSQWVDVAAPGVGIMSTTGGAYASWGGTSMASPHVAGLAGLLWATKYGTSNTSVRSRIETTADRIPAPGSYWRWGRINAFKAVQ